MEPSIRAVDTASSLTVSVLRGGRGMWAADGTSTAARPLELYEFESCPYCRKVREVLSELDLEYVSRKGLGQSRSREQAAVPLSRRSEHR